MSSGVVAIYSAIAVLPHMRSRHVALLVHQAVWVSLEILLRDDGLAVIALDSDAAHSWIVIFILFQIN
jgi:hypothetical protein